MVCLFVFSVAALVCAARGSPNAAHIAAHVAASYSDDIYEDARLDVPELVRKYGYPLEVHELTTSDGYILQMHRIPHGRNTHSAGPRQPVFVQHGLLCSSADWIVMGPGKGLAYILAEEGYDVWLGNARGNYYSRRHLDLRPDAILNTKFWDFSWHEIGLIDLPEMIDYVLASTGYSKLHFIGHSQGTTAFWVMASRRPEYNDKVIGMHALAPVAYMGNVPSLLLRAIAPFAHTAEVVTSALGVGEFLPNNEVMSWAGEAACKDESSLQELCTNILFLVGGRNEAQMNTTMLPVIIGHAPAGASTKQFMHYGQGIDTSRFRFYSYGRVKNLLTHGSVSPPSYDLGEVTTPVFLHYSDSDPLAHVTDVDQLFRELGAPAGKFRVQDGSFSHLDFMWGVDAKSLLYDRVLNLMRALE